MYNRFLLFFLFVIVSNCTNNNSELMEIKRLSNIEFPDETEILLYEDDIENSLKFKLKLNDSIFQELMNKELFKTYNSDNLYESISKYSYHDHIILNFESFMNSSFSNDEKEELVFYEYENCMIILNPKNKILNGLVLY